MLNIVYGGVPGMHLDGTDLDQAEQPFKIIDPQPGAFAAFTLLHCESMHGRWYLWQWTLMIERDAVNVADELERSPAEIFEGFLRHARPVGCQLFFRRHGRAWQ